MSTPFQSDLFWISWKIYFNGLTLLPKTLQDYEYASFNPVAYDIANHFCEMAADYHSEKPHILDYTKYPGTKYIWRLEAVDMCIAICSLDILIGPMLIHSSFAFTLKNATDTNERRQFVHTYLSSSGKQKVNHQHQFNPPLPVYK